MNELKRKYQHYPQIPTLDLIFNNFEHKNLKQIANIFNELCTELEIQTNNSNSNIQSLHKQIYKNIIKPDNNIIIQKLIETIETKQIEKIKQFDKQHRNSNKTCVIFRKSGFSRNNIQTIRQEV